MGITKKRLSNKDFCKVTFTLPSHLSETAKTACIVGEFNDWELPGLRMRRTKAGFTITIKLQINKDYQFRYLVDENHWETDWDADELVRISFLDEYNSVVKV